MLGDASQKRWLRSGVSCIGATGVVGAAGTSIAMMGLEIDSSDEIITGVSGAATTRVGASPEPTRILELSSIAETVTGAGVFANTGFSVTIDASLVFSIFMIGFEIASGSFAGGVPPSLARMLPCPAGVEPSFFGFLRRSSKSHIMRKLKVSKMSLARFSGERKFLTLFFVFPIIKVEICLQFEFGFFRFLNRIWRYNYVIRSSP